MSLTIIENEDAIWHTEEYDVILVGTSIYNMLTNGFQRKLKKKYPEIDKANKTTNYGDRRKLGKRLTIDGNPTISLLYICGFPGLRHGPSIKYEALENALQTAAAEFKGKRVMATMIGCSNFDGDGDKEKVLELIKTHCKDLDLTIYDYHQMSRRGESFAIFKKMIKGKSRKTDEYKERYKEYEEMLKKLYLD